MLSSCQRRFHYHWQQRLIGELELRSQERRPGISANDDDLPHVRL